MTNKDVLEVKGGDIIRKQRDLKNLLVLLCIISVLGFSMCVMAYFRHL